ncbi:hypothetical protein [Lapillicoccus sp.]|uniref:hypothetical protein n=1 Tax=Lapillicoccus sp. TaxID=1909287 RepID=UPI0027BF04E6|nr:hypothetical protein [Actinomycetota bacterium]
MVVLVLGMLVCLVGGIAVMGFVAVQARRDGRDVLTPRGEEVVDLVRTHTEALSSKTDAARHRTSDLVTATRDRIHPQH